MKYISQEGIKFHLKDTIPPQPDWILPPSKADQLIWKDPSDPEKERRVWGAHFDLVYGDGKPAGYVIVHRGIGGEFRQKNPRRPLYLYFAAETEVTPDGEIYNMSWLEAADINGHCRRLLGVLDPKTKVGENPKLIKASR